MESNDIIDKLPDFVIPDYYDALGILFANRDWMPRFVDETGKERLAIIEVIRNNQDEAREAIQLALKKRQKYVKPSNNTISAINNSEVLQFAKKIFSGGMLGTMQLSSGIVSKDFIEGVTADLLEQYLSKHQSQHSFFDNTKILNQLSNIKLKLIEPWLQASVCGKCHNFELLLSSYPKKAATCSQCERDMFTVRIYKIDASYERHKLENKDLPLFIKSYMTNKRPDIEVHVTYKMNKKEGSSILGDIDVYIPIMKLGIECKLFVNPYPQGNQFDTYQGELSSIFLKYADYGLNRLIGITNLSQKDAANMERSLKLQLEKEGWGGTSVRIGHFSLENLLSVLDEELSLIPSQNT